MNALGHAHPQITKVIKDQAGKLIHSSNLYYHEYQGPLAKKARGSQRLCREFSSAIRARSPWKAALKMVRSHGSHLA